MKKHVQLLALISSILFLLGLVFKIMHFPGAGILLLLGSLIGVLFLSLFMGNTARVGEHAIAKITLILGSFTLIFVVLGFLFKVMHGLGLVSYLPFLT